MDTTREPIETPPAIAVPAADDWWDELMLELAEDRSIHTIHPQACYL